MKTREAIIHSVFVMSIGSAMILSACGPSVTPEPAKQAGQLATIDFAQVEVGLGSPTPVTLTMDVSYPSTCAQFSQISQEIVKDGDNTRIMIEVHTLDMGEVCTQDALSFRMSLPINTVALPKGIYSVEVNGVDAGSFEFQH
ncbi:MAG TPA: hypothetical protein VFY83_14955 [Anaerolineales bacterium]|nr:hypothetical protein [Anaerolineales bacterium]